MSNIISIQTNEERPKNRNLGRASVNVRGAELAKSSNSDKTMDVVIAIILMIFFGALRFNTIFREAITEQTVIIMVVFIGFAMLLVWTLCIEWFRNSPPRDNFALATRAAVAILLISICYMYPVIGLSILFLSVGAFIC